MSDWQPIATAPKDGTRMLLCSVLHDPTVPVTGQWSRFSKRWGTVYDITPLYPTHWMPLPAAPHPEEND